MKRYFLIILAILVMIPSVDAQTGKKGVRAKKSKKPKKEVVVEDPRIAQMLAATQQIMFIDSIVANKRDFMRHIPLSSDAGLAEQNDTLGQFTNELRDHRLTVRYDVKDSACHIYQSDYIANTWTPLVRVQGISDSSANYPFLMPDGITLYYSQKGENSIGGYDLFVTRYDSEAGAFLRPENIGMPFSSTANDYFYAIDEANNLGYFVTDRRQPNGKVCIYIFEPNQTRKIYQSEAYAEPQLRALADISKISDTWSNKSQRKLALDRLAEAKKNTITAAKSNTPKNELEQLRHQAEVLEKALLLARNYYARASESERQSLRSEILNSEKELETLQLEIRSAEKAQRNAMYKNNN